MNSRIFDGTTVIFAGTSVGALTGLSYTVDGKKVQVTTVADLLHVFEVSLFQEIELSLDLIGTTPSSASVGTSSTMAINLSTGVTLQPTWPAVVTKTTNKGKIGSEWATTLDLSPTHS